MPQSPDPILTAAQMRAAEARIAPDAEALYELMERAGAGVADYVWRLAAGAEVLVVCGPGNNGGDGYVAARILRERGASVRVCAAYPPGTELAQRAAELWAAPVEELWDCDPAPILVDAVFGTGSLRRLGWDLFEPLNCLADAARRVVAVDLPSGLDADEGLFCAEYDITRTPRTDVTLALGALKNAHIMPKAILDCGEVRLIDIGLGIKNWPITTNPRPVPPGITADSHKYSRGMVGIVSGEMPGAALLAASGAAHAGAGYVAVYGGNGGGPASLVHKPLSEEALSNERLGAVVIGPGLGRGGEARRWVDFLVTQTRKMLVIDADALHLVDFAALANRMDAAILTPHAGEFYFMCKRANIAWQEGLTVTEQLQREIRELGLGDNAVLVKKGSTTYIARGEKMRVSPRGNPWLSAAGTGDVLAGAIGAMLALYGNNGGDSLDAAAAGVWLHAEAADLLPPAFIADNLARALQDARAKL